MEVSESQPIFRALADPTRRQILMHLSQSDMSIAQLVDQFAITRGAVKKHLKILEEGDLISVRASGRERINHLEAASLKPASDWMTFFSQFWDDKFNRLQSAVEQENNHG